MCIPEISESRGDPIPAISTTIRYDDTLVGRPNVNALAHSSKTIKTHEATPYLLAVCKFPTTATTTAAEALQLAASHHGVRV